MRYKYTKRQPREGGETKVGVIYVRVSSDEQKLDGFSIPAQRRLLAEAQRYRHSQRRQQMGSVNLTEHQPITHRRPARGANQFQRDTLRFGKSAFMRNCQNGDIGQRQEGDPHTRRHSPSPSRSLAVMSACATSTIFLPWFIALLRSRA